MKIKLLLTTMLFNSMVLLAQISTTSLVVYFPFNNNANDASGNANNGTVNGATLVSDRFGNPNAAYNFNGTSDYVQVPHSTSLSFPDNKISISFWMKVSAWPMDNNEHYLFQKQSGTGAAQSGFHIYAYGATSASSNDELVFRYRNGNSSNWGSAEYATDSLPGISSWFNVTYTSDSTYTNMYVNGNLVNQQTAQIIGANTNDLFIGKGSTGSNFVGTLDDIRIYNRVLNPLEISAIYNEGLCYQTITVTDTLIINMNITGFNPVTYSSFIKIYPNPANTQINIDVANYQSLNGYSIKITNTLSQTVYQTNITQGAYNVALNTFGGQGLYFVNVYDMHNNLIDVKKIILQ